MSLLEETSIIIPVYCKTVESLNWLKECVESAISQGCEVVCVDDGSPYDTAPILSNYNIRRWFRDVNKGVAYTRNQATALASGKLILPLDCDDRLVPGAVERLLTLWDGATPVYPDVKMFGTKVDPHYKLLDFDCDHLLNHVGFTSVNVLHLKEQWKAIHGWDARIDFYEDGEYNARLMGTYCGKHCPEPLVEYRMHPDQRTEQFKKVAGERAQQLTTKIRSYEMACSSCSKRRAARQAAQQDQTFGTRSGSATVVIGAAPTNLPTTFEGKTLVQYAGGKGMAKHYYDSPVTGVSRYVQYGDWLYVDPRDAGQGYYKLPVSTPKEPTAEPVVQRVEPTQAISAPVEPTPVMETAAALPVRTPSKHISRTPVVEAQDLPELANLSYEQIRGLDMTPELARKLIPLEQGGQNRAKVLSYLRLEAGKAQKEQ